MYLYFCLKKQWETGRDILKEGGGGILVCAYHVHLYILTSFHITVRSCVIVRFLDVLRFTCI